ncbi:MAG: hypothetical protein PHC61_11275, partial [Chitinivibrionales bacterium]|nr:hypothetical protein [Chitinivibrionales bacterium]
MNKSKIKTFGFSLVLACFAFCHAARIDRLDIFDKSDNFLLFVTFNYDAAGNAIGRSVFTADSTFLRSTTFQTSGTTTKEASLDFNGNSLFTTTISAPSGNNTAFSTVDQFGMDQFGGSMTYSSGPTNTFNINQNSALTCMEQYTFGADG